MAADGLVGRAVNVGQALASAHLAVARNEARRDLGRMVAAAVLIGGGLSCLVSAWFLAHALAILAVRAAGRPPMEALALVGAADLGLAGVLLLAGRALLRRPLLRESREMLRQTATAIAGGG